MEISRPSCNDARSSAQNIHAHHSLLFRIIFALMIVVRCESFCSRLLFQHGKRGHVIFKEQLHPIRSKRQFSWRARSTESSDDNDSSTTSSQIKSIVQLDNVKRVFCLSDLHTDHAGNMQWLRDRMADSDLTQDDVLVVAGDISHELDRLEESLQLMCEKCQVFFLPGNHEAWLRSGDKFDSLQKLDMVEMCCRAQEQKTRTGGVVHVDALYLRGRHPLWIVPLQSWYDGTLSFNEELCHDFHNWPWVDFQRCRWPRQDFPLLPAPNAKIPDGLVDYFHDDINEPLISAVVEMEQELRAASSSSPSALMTVSHFLPNVQTLPDWKDLETDEFSMDWLDHGAAAMSAKFAKVAGSAWLDEQIRSMQDFFSRQIHVFGHSHRPKDFQYRDIRYIHNPLGKPRERELHMVSPDVDFKLVWDVQGQGEVMGPEVLRYWEEYGGGRAALRERMERVRPGRYDQNP